jgi:uncharacterized membrane protein YcjF (UPF0283 family)
MRRLVNTIALGAALVTVGVSLWRDDTAWTALTRAAIAYLAFFIVGALLALAYRAGVVAENRPAAPVSQRGASGTKGSGKA